MLIKVSKWITRITLRSRRWLNLKIILVSYKIIKTKIKEYKLRIINIYKYIKLKELKILKVIFYHYIIRKKAQKVLDEKIYQITLSINLITLYLLLLLVTTLTWIMKKSR